MNAQQPHPCPQCGRPTEFVPDGMIEFRNKIAVNRRDHPRGIVTDILRMPASYYACNYCEWCGDEKFKES